MTDRRPSCSDRKGSAPRVLIVDLSRNVGGASSRCGGLLAGMPSGRAALAALEGSPILQSATAEGCECHAVGRDKRDPRLLVNMTRLIRSGGFQLLDTQNSQSKFWGSLAAAWTRTALVSTLNSWYRAEHGGRIKGEIFHWLEASTSRLTNMYIAVSRDIETQLVASGIAKDNVACIPNAVSIDSEAVVSSRREICAEFSLPPDALIGCAVGRLVPAKGYDVLIRAVGLQRASRFHCIVVGDGPLRPSLERQVAAAGLERRIHFAGERSHQDVMRLMKSADLFVMCSRSEGTPVVILEAGALGAPIVAPSVGGIPEMLRDGEHAKLFAPEDSRGLADAIGYLMANPGVAARLGKNARGHVRRSFSVTEQVRATLEVYDHAVDGFARRHGSSRRFVRE